MNKTILALLPRHGRWGAAALLALGGCATPHSPAPIATHFATTEQRQLQAASHWTVIASDAAASLLAALRANGACPDSGGACGRVAIRNDARDTAFGRAFESQLVTSLVSQGVGIVTDPAAVTQIAVDVQTVRFDAKRRQGRFISITALAGRVLAVREVAEHSDTAAGLLAAGVMDTAYWFGSKQAFGVTPKHEIIVNLSAIHAGRYLARTTNVYYVADADAGLYRPAGGSLLYTLPVRGGE
jgi:hypothetical protein